MVKYSPMHSNSEKMMMARFQADKPNAIFFVKTASCHFDEYFLALLGLGASFYSAILNN